MSTPDDLTKTVKQNPIPDITPLFEQSTDSAGTVASTPEIAALSASLSNQTNEMFIVGRYRLLNEIGRGGMGVIFAAKDITLNRDVAVKLLQDRFHATSEVAKRFVEEAKITGQLQHPGIAPVHDLGETANGRPFLAMKLIKGQTLSKLLEENHQQLNPSITEPPKIDNLIKIYFEIAQTVAYAHSKGVIHRDLKPANVMVGAFGEVQVMDWGLAKLLKTDNKISDVDHQTNHEIIKPEIDIDRSPDSATIDGSIMGTPAYMPPEQAKGEIDKIDARSDVFSLGAILCEILTGQPPYTGNYQEIRAKSVAGEIQPAIERIMQSKADQELTQLAIQCLNTDRSARPEDASEIVSILNRYRHSVTERLRLAENEKAAADIRIAEQIKRKRIWYTLAAILIIGTTTSVVLAIRSYQQAVRADGATVLAQGETIRANNEAKLAIERSEDLAKANVEITNQKTQTEKQLDRAESLIYSNTIQDANKFWREQRNDVALEKLNFARIDLRGWEHDLLFTEIMNGSAIIHYNCTQPTLHNTDNDYKIVSSFNDHSLEIMNSQSSNVKNKLKGHTQDVLCTNLSKKGDLLVSGSVDNTVRIWDTSTGRNLATLKGHTKPVSAVCFSHDGLKVISCSEDKTVRIWEVKSEKNLLTLKGHRDAVNCLAVTPDGQRIISCSWDRKIRIWNMESGKLISEFTSDQDFVSCIAISPDGLRFATGSFDKTIQVWDLMTKQPLALLKGHDEGVTCIAISPDGMNIISGSADKTIRSWDIQSGNPVALFKGHFGSINSVFVSKNGMNIMSASSDRTIRVWDIKGGIRLENSKNGANNLNKANPDVKPFMGNLSDFSAKRNTIVISRDGTRMVSTMSKDSRIKLWDFKTFQILASYNFTKPLVVSKKKSDPNQTKPKGHRGNVTCLAISPDNSKIISGGIDHTIQIWDSTTGQHLTELKGHTELIKSLFVSHDGQNLVSGSWDKSIRVWDLKTGQLLKVLNGHTAEVSSVTMSPDGSQIISGSWDNTIRIWDVHTGQQIAVLKGHRFGVYAVAVSPNGKFILSGSADNLVCIWNRQSGHQLAELRGHSGAVNSVAFSPDGQRIISGSTDRTVRVWDTKSKLPLIELSGHTGGVLQATMSPDGCRIISCSTDQTIHGWETFLQQPTTELTRFPQSVTAVAFSKDGSKAFARDRDGTTRSWSTTTGLPDPEELPSPEFSEANQVWSPDRNWSLSFSENSVFLHNEQKCAHFDRQMKVRLKYMTQPQPDWHMARANEYDQQGHDFATRFHLTQYVKQVPTDFASVVRLASIETKMNENQKK